MSRFRSRRPPQQQQQLPVQDEIRELPPRRQPAAQPSRGRLQVSQINVQPQFDLGQVDEPAQETQEFESFFPSFDPVRQG